LTTKTNAPYRIKDEISFLESEISFLKSRIAELVKENAALGRDNTAQNAQISRLQEKLKSALLSPDRKKEQARRMLKLCLLVLAGCVCVGSSMLWGGAGLKWGVLSCVTIAAFIGILVYGTGA
jgi:hypothetical protein